MAGIIERLDAARSAEEDIRFEETKAVAEIDREISALQTKREILRDCYREKYQAARQVTRAIYDEKNASEKALGRSLDEKFPDLVGQARWSAAVWKPAS